MIMVVADVSAVRMGDGRSWAEAAVVYFRTGCTMAVGTVAIM